MLAGLMLSTVSTKQIQAADGSTVLEQRCTTCHGAGRIERAGHDLDGWKNTVERMEGKGAFGNALTDAERQALLDHLITL